MAASAMVASGQVAKGITPFQTYGAGSIDSINQIDLNVHIHIPVYTSKGRGLPFQYSLDYDGTIWQPVVVNGQRVWAAPANAWGWQGNASGNAGGYTFVDTQDSCVDEFGYTDYYDDYSDFAWTDPQGVSHAFPSVETYDPPQECGYGDPVESSSGVAADGSGYTMNVTVYEDAQVVSASGVVYNPTDITLGRAGASPGVEDANGNEITESDGSGTRTWTDTLGNQIEEWSSGSEGVTQVTYPGPSGSESVTTVYSPQTVSTSDLSCGSGTAPGAWGPATEYLLTQIHFPDGTGYSMTYEPNGSLASITLPTGGAIYYDHQASGGTEGINCGDGTWNALNRETSAASGEWVYTRNPGGTTGEWVTVQSSAGIEQSGATIYSMNGYETERDVFTYQGGSTPVEVDLLCYNGNTTNCRTTPVGAYYPISQRNELRYLGPVASGTKTAETITKYSAYGLPTEEDDYDFGNGSPGALLRRVLTSYATLGGGNINDKPSQITVDGGSVATTVAQTNFAYDQGSVASTVGTPQHASGVNAGNLTEVDEYTSSGSHLAQTFSYFDTGLVAAATAVTGAVTHYQYGQCGNGMLTQVTNPDSTSVQTSWYCSGAAPDVVTGENGEQTTYAYAGTQADWQSEPSSVTGPDGTETMTYTANSVETAQVFNSGASTDDTVACYDSLGRPYLRQRRQAPGSSSFDTVETFFDAVGRITAVSAPASAGQCAAPSSPVNAKSWIYDQQGRPTSLTDAGGGTITYAYNANDVLMTLGPAPTKQRQLEYNALGQLASVCEITSGTGNTACGQTNGGSGYITSYTRDPAGRLTQISETGSGTTQTRTTTFDWLGRALTEKVPETNQVPTQYFYGTSAGCGGGVNDAGSRVERLDPAGNVTCYVHDNMGRVVERWYPVVASGFDLPPYAYFVYGAGHTVDGQPMQNGAGRLVEAYTQSGATVQSDEGFSYAADGRLAGEYAKTLHETNYTAVFANYLPNGVISSLSTNLNGVPNITYGADGEGRWSTVGASSGQAPVSGTQYNVFGEPTEVDLGSGDKDIFGYDAALGRMKTFTADVGTGSLAATLSWNANGTLGNLTATDTLPGGGANAQNCTYGYDDLARLASVSCNPGAWSQTFATDAFGNFSTSGNRSFSATFNLATNQISDLGATYDADGDVTGDSQHSFGWDVNQRPTSVDGALASYDALDRLIEKYQGGVFYQLIYGPSGRLGIAQNGVATKLEVPLPGGDAAIYNSGGLQYYRHADWQGSGRVGSTPSQTLVFDQAFSPYGEVEAGGSAADRQWAQLGDNISGDLYDAQAREFEDVAARWSSPDPAGLSAADLADPQTLNLYAYTAGQPLTATDPSGEFPWWILGFGNPPAEMPAGEVWGARVAVGVAGPYIGRGLIDLGKLFGRWIGGLFSGSAPIVNTARAAANSQVHDYAGVNWNGALEGEVDGMPVGMSIPAPDPFSFGGAGNCDFGACVGAEGFDADPDAAISSWWRVLQAHLRKLADEPGSDAVGDWEHEVKTLAGNIFRKAEKVTQKRRAGSLERYLQRLGIPLDELDRYLPSPVIIVNPCRIGPNPVCASWPAIPPSA